MATEYIYKDDNLSIFEKIKKYFIRIHRKYQNKYRNKYKIAPSG